jgi:hypothetical protein
MLADSIIFSLLLLISLTTLVLAVVVMILLYTFILSKTNISSKDKKILKKLKS